jgi:hypothetical protein
MGRRLCCLGGPTSGGILWLSFGFLKTESLIGVHVYFKRILAQSLSRELPGISSWSEELAKP